MAEYEEIERDERGDPVRWVELPATTTATERIVRSQVSQRSFDIAKQAVKGWQ